MPVTGLENNQNELQGWSMFIEQDLFYLLDPDKNEDRDYTIGIDVALHGEIASRSYLYDALHYLDEIVGFDRGMWQGSLQRSTHLGVAVYTPDDLANPDPIYDDRPYASLIYWSNKTRRIRTDGQAGIATELTFGVLGTEIAKAVQTFIHKLQREISNSDTPVEPRGWDHQISEGGELTFRYHIEYKHLLTQGAWYDFSSAMIGNLGYQTDASAGLLWRVGKRASHFAFFEPQPAQQFNQFSDISTQQDNYLYLYYQLTGVVYNELLQGGFRDSDVTFGSDQIERLVQTLAIGWTQTLESGTRLTFAQYMRSPEFKGPNSHTHYWGGFYLTFPFESGK